MAQISNIVTVKRVQNQDKTGVWARTQGVLRKHGFYYLLFLPAALYFIIFRYLPMFGLVIAFKDVSPFAGLDGILNEPFVGFKHFQNFFRSYFFWDIMENTVMISLWKTLWGFPAPIILALLINEVRNVFFKRTMQTISYLPHFLSMVVVAGLVYVVLGVQGGLVNHIVRFFGGGAQNFLGNPKYFRTILVTTSVWQTVGWGSILYLAAMASINPELYEAAMIDGANKWHQAWSVTLPSITYVIVILLIFRIGDLLDAGFEQILLLYSPAVYGVADIIDTYVYRAGLLDLKYSFGTAVGLFKSVVALFLLLAANKIAHRLGHTGIW
ncbi:MAG: ABC transporter permease subunit [Caldilineaceae bacterium]